MRFRKRPALPVPSVAARIRKPCLGDAVRRPVQLVPVPAPVRPGCDPAPRSSACTASTSSANRGGAPESRSAFGNFGAARFRQSSEGHVQAPRPGFQEPARPPEASTRMPGWPPSPGSLRTTLPVQRTSWLGSRAVLQAMQVRVGRLPFSISAEAAVDSPAAPSPLPVRPRPPRPKSGTPFTPTGRRIPSDAPSSFRPSWWWPRRRPSNRTPARTPRSWTALHRRPCPAPPPPPPHGRARRRARCAGGSPPPGIDRPRS